MRIVRLAGVVLATGVLAAACSTGATPTPSAELSPSPAASSAASPSPAASPSALACAPSDLKTLTAGKLTVGTDNPAFPPYFAIRKGGNNPPWEDLGYTGDPTTGEGFESAVAYAIADRLGFTKDQVVWVVVPFDTSYAPGDKPYDFDINQISYTPERAQAVDLSEGYYDLNQAVVAMKTNAAAKATSIADLKDAQFGAQQGTTSYQAIVDVIKPSKEPKVYSDNTAAIQALQGGQIDALVVDLPTSDYITSVQIENSAATIVGQLAPFGGTQEYVSVALAKDSPLTPCVNQAITTLRDDGTLGQLASKWLPFQDAVPVLK